MTQCLTMVPGNARVCFLFLVKAEGLGIQMTEEAADLILEISKSIHLLSK